MYLIKKRYSTLEGNNIIIYSYLNMFDKQGYSILEGNNIVYCKLYYFVKEFLGLLKVKLFVEII